MSAKYRNADWVLKATLGVLAFAGLALVLIFGEGCAAQSAEQPWIQAQGGPNGERCYIVWQGDRVAGGNCER